MTTSKTHPIAEELFSSILGAYLSYTLSPSLFLPCKSVNLSWPAKPSPRLWARPSLDRVMGLKSISQATWRAGAANWLKKFHSEQDTSTPVIPVTSPPPPKNPPSHPQTLKHPRPSRSWHSLTSSNFTLNCSGSFQGDGALRADPSYPQKGYDSSLQAMMQMWWLSFTTNEQQGRRINSWVWKK